MGRNPNWMDAVRSARADWELATGYPELHQAADAWQDTGDLERLERALDALEIDTERRGYPPLGPELNRAERVVALAARIVTISQVAARMRRQTDAIEAMRDAIRDELAATLALPAADRLTSYHRRLAEHLEADGILAADLHPATRELGQTVAGAIRQLNAKRRGAKRLPAGEDYAEHFPIAGWADLPRAFAAFELVDVAAEDATDDSPCPLPPSTDTAFFTADRRPLQPQGSLRDTIAAWSKIIETWCIEQDVHLAPIQRAAWAMLLGHRLKNDGSKVSNLDSVELMSPWAEGELVRVKVLPPPPVDA